MIKSLARAVSLGSLLCAPLAGAYQFGEHAAGTVDKLIHDYPGRYRDTASFAGAADWMESRMGSGYALGRQNFSWNDGTRTSQNVIASAAGLSDQYVVIGAHFDTYFGRPTLQGLDDNASGAGVLTEVARNLSGLRLENGLEIVGFGAEEEGLRGSRAYVAALDDARRANLLAMINIDSLITGDMMYAHAGQNSADNPELASLREHAARIAGELGIDLRANPGLNPDYPVGTGCCSDGEAFEDLGVPILYVESTNWDIGDLDGYEQTTNPAIPGGSTWHDPVEDNETVLVGAFGEERIEQRLRDYSRLLSRLMLELTNADLLASAASGGATARNMQDHLQRQYQAQSQLHERRWQLLQAMQREVGSFDGAIGVDGEYAPDSGFDEAPNPEARRYGIHALGDLRVSELLSVGASLSYQNGRDDLEHGGKLDSDAWRLGAFALLSDGGPAWLGADLGVAHTRLDSERALRIQADGGPVLLERRFSADTDALTWGARLLGGYDFSFGDLRSGPFAGLDYSHSRIDDFSEKGADRTALGYEEQDYDSLEASLGWRLQGSLALDGSLRLLPYASVAWVKELGDGRLEDIALTSRADGRVRVAELGDVDTSFGRARLGSQLQIGDSLGLFVEVNGRLGHDEGSQTGYSLGAQWLF